MCKGPVSTLGLFFGLSLLIKVPWRIHNQNLTSRARPIGFLETRVGICDDVKETGALPKWRTVWRPWTLRKEQYGSFQCDLFSVSMEQFTFPFFCIIVIFAFSSCKLYVQIGRFFHSLVQKETSRFACSKRNCHVWSYIKNFKCCIINHISSISRICFSKYECDCTWSNHWLHHNTRSLMTTSPQIDLLLKLDNGRFSCRDTRLCYFLAFYSAVENESHFTSEYPPIWSLWR